MVVVIILLAAGTRSEEVEVMVVVIVWLAAGTGSEEILVIVSQAAETEAKR